MTPVNALGSGQAQVLAAILHRAPNGPVSIIDIARDLGLRTTTVRRHLTHLAAWGLVHPHVDERHVTPLVRPLSLEQAARTVKDLRPLSRVVGRMSEGPPCANRTTPLPHPTH